MTNVPIGNPNLQPLDLRVEKVRKWLDGGASSWGVPAQEIRALMAKATRSDEAVDIAREALGRIASNGFGFPIRMIDHKRDKELIAAMDYAREAGQRIAALNPPGAE